MVDVVNVWAIYQLRNSVVRENVLLIQKISSVNVAMMDEGATVEAITWLRDVDKLIRFKGDDEMETELDLIIGVLNGKLKVK